MSLQLAILIRPIPNQAWAWLCKLTETCSTICIYIGFIHVNVLKVRYTHTNVTNKSNFKKPGNQVFVLAFGWHAPGLKSLAKCTWIYIANLKFYKMHTTTTIRPHLSIRHYTHTLNWLAIAISINQLYKLVHHKY